GIAKLPRLVGKILFRDNIFADVPPAKIAAQYKLELHLSLFLAPNLGVRIEEIVLAVMSNHLTQGFVAAVDVFEFHVKNRVDPVFAQKRTKAVFPAITSENGAVVLGGLAVEVYLRSPPLGGPIFEFHRTADKAVPVRRLAHRVEEFDF